MKYIFCHLGWTNYWVIIIIYIKKTYYYIQNKLEENKIHHDSDKNEWIYKETVNCN